MLNSYMVFAYHAVSYFKQRQCVFFIGDYNLGWIYCLLKFHLI